MASRLEALNKLYGTDILVSEDVERRVGWQFLMRLIDRVKPVGVNTPINVYELMAARPGLTTLPTALEASEAQRELCALWARAYKAYAERDWERALSAFEAVQSSYPQDGPARVFVDRCRTCINMPPGPDWDGVTVLNSK